MYADYKDQLLKHEGTEAVENFDSFWGEHHEYYVDDEKKDNCQKVGERNYEL